MDDTRQMLEVEARKFFGESRKRCGQGDSVIVEEIVHDSDLDIPLHRHETARICVLLDGKLTENDHGRTVELRKGSIVFWPPGTEHGDRFGRGPNRTLQFELSLNEFQTLREHFPPATQPLRGELFGATIRRIRDELDRSDANTGLLLRSAVYEMVAIANRIRNTRALPGLGIHLAARFIEEHIGESLRLGDVAERVGLRPRRLSESFRDELGMSFRDYIMQLRLERAAHALMLSDEPISDIASRLGFYDQAQLSRFFKLRTGLSPRTYRRRSRSRSSQ
jgi:AraC-like DNA-binding protein/mannose-6-phosphate isomerase-like protein (cupin superfamily)